MGAKVQKTGLADDRHGDFAGGIYLTEASQC